MLLRHYLILNFIFYTAATDQILYKIGLLLDSEDQPGSEAINRLADYTISTLPKSDVNLELEIRYYNWTYLSLMNGICSLIDQNVVAIISASDSTSTVIQSDLIQQYRIPLIAAAATNPFKHTANNLELRLSPSDFHQSEAIYALLKEFSWFEFSILASADTYGIRSTIQLQHLASQDGNFHFKDIQYFNVKKDLSLSSEVKLFSEELGIIERSLVRVVVLSCPGRFAKRIFR